MNAKINAQLTYCPDLGVCRLMNTINGRDKVVPISDIKSAWPELWAFAEKNPNTPIAVAFNQNQKATGEG